MRTRLGHYDIVSELGRGGMGVVYKGFEGTLHRYVAIKVLADSLAHDEAIRERFLREARSMAALNDPHIIQIYFIGEDEGQPFFVMEFVEGESLGSMLKRDHRLTVEQAAKIIHQTAMGLATAHDRGVVHRDIKPGNLMISSRGVVKIADFGIALSNQDISKKLTSTGEFVGTPGYLSPEVCLGKPVDQRSDIFSLGIVLFEMLTGKMPFSDESPLGLMLEVVRAEIPDVRELNADVDPQIAHILSRMIAKDPAQRYPSCHELVADLASHPLIVKGGPITVQTRLSPAAATLVGQKTPVSGRVELPSTPPPPSSGDGAATRITPVSQSAAPAIAPADAATTPAAHRQVLGGATGTSRNPVLAWAVAAILVLAIVGTAWSYRADIPGLKAWFGAPAPAIANQPAAEAHGVAASTPAPVAPATSHDAAIAQAGTSPPVAAPADPSAPPVAPSEGDAADGVALTTGAGDGPAARAAPADLEALRELPAAQAAAAAATEPAQVAKATPAPKPAAKPRPHVPTVAVVAAGDAVLASPAGELVMQRLRARGFRVIEGGQVDADHPNLLGLLGLAGKADAVVAIIARPVGSQEMQFYGQYATLYTAQVGIKIYRVADRSVVYSSGVQQVNFTTLNATDQARDAILPMLERADGELDEFRPQGKRG
ncbi:protein kinase domain-containing protein [Dokdonella sp.]|uniref:serine/threonine-protein kinase n=1 Tax=Dokdonella sp. TaxID=2291710 RepID=UPI0031BE02AB|nr:protein kinase [Dokdonella sp.]